MSNTQNYHLVQIILHDLTISCRKSTKDYLNIEFPSNTFWPLNLAHCAVTWNTFNVPLCHTLYFILFDKIIKQQCMFWQLLCIRLFTLFMLHKLHQYWSNIIFNLLPSSSKIHACSAVGVQYAFPLYRWQGLVPKYLRQLWPLYPAKWQTDWLLINPSWLLASASSPY